MKRLLALSAIVFAIACNSGESSESSETETSTGVDSFSNSNPAKNINDTPLRTRDTTTNLMKDTMQPGDTTPTPR